MLKWSNIEAYALLMRMDKPIGTYLLLWPTFWALWIAASGYPGWHLLAVFGLGVFVMRSAGCVINDFADRNLDGHVERTSGRPLPSGQVSAKESIALFFLLMFIALGLVLSLDWHTILMSLPAAALAAIYPFMKRFTQLPQLVLGLAFSWGIPMVYVATMGYVSADGWWMFAANVVWTIGYDTKYAMVDREDDLKIGIKSTAILFGRFDKTAVALCQVFTLFAMLMVGDINAMPPIYYGCLAIAALMFIYQQWLIRNRDRAKCFAAFKHNHLVGLIIFIGILLSQ